ncbi:MAG TPA: MFS transporter [Stellaceae bacterium]|nr:MFS transporter [Stellaceae bacterium]
MPDDSAAAPPPHPNPLRPNGVERGIDALTEAQRRWSLAAAIGAVAIFGMGVGFATPLFSLTLEARGTEASLTGLNAAAGYLGVLVGPLWTPMLVRRFGLRAFLLACLALDVAIFLPMKPFDGLGAWFALRFMLGMAGSSVFTASEAWINMLAGDKSRGRVIGAYAAALAGGFALGPLLLGLTGIAGWTPYLAGAAISAAAALPLIGVGSLARSLGREKSASLFAIVARAPFIVLAVALYGCFESAAMALLPIWGVRVGFDRVAAAALLTALGFGAIALQLPIGWLSDKLDRISVLRLCAAGGFAGAALMPLLAASGASTIFAAVLVWGGLAAGIYPVALAMAGARFRGAELVGANAALIVAYGAGSLIGPSVGGMAMDLWDPEGLLAALALLFALFLATTLLPRRRVLS